MSGTRARFPLIGPLNGRSTPVAYPILDAAGFAALLTFPGLDLLKDHATRRVGDIDDKARPG